ncbi:MAG: LTA synthase family protein [Saprospiraceae bacterium]|nr:LTA synthase family protein [Saprospiraceae bacterium]MDG1435897.1 LTA synthase family protein [Saprospiraceae bacterium]MDG2417694.1 LTA synthase family protein [Saprospiraceae bacterium]
MKLRGELFFLKQLGLRFIGLLFVWMICRVGFFIFNLEAFPIDGYWSFIKLLFFGLRFDLAALVYLNSLLVLTYIIPSSIRDNLTYQKIQKWIFIITNSIALIFEVGDIGYFRFAFRRAIGSDLNLIGETTNMTFQFLYDFWYLLLFYSLMVSFLHFTFKKLTLSSSSIKTNFLIQIVIFPFAIGFLILGMRGGVQLRPIMPLTAAQYVDDMRLMPLQSNTTLSLLFSVQQNFIEEKNYMSKEEEAKLFSFTKTPTPKGEFKKDNIFLIVLESFGKEHIGFFNDYEKSPTPFIDSLMLESWYFENAYAAGTRSTQGIAAISASVPALMDNALTFSPYQGNQLAGIASHLGKKGYTSGFFHGSNPGSMEFERFSKLTGYQKFYDRTVYPSQKDYDGNWGIWDAPFFQFTAKEIDQYQQPFTALLFSLTSHHPYYVEKYFEEKHPNEEPILRAIRYTDFALRHFFETVKKMDWYDNTLFVITADHIGKRAMKKYGTAVGMYQIPLFFFKPNSDLKGRNSNITQQTDILPTILDYINYDIPFFSSGESALDTFTNKNAYMYSNQIYQILNDSLILSYNQKETIGVYNYKKDVFLQNDLKDKSNTVNTILENKLKAVIQAHHRAMINNQLVLPDK